MFSTYQYQNLSAAEIEKLISRNADSDNEVRKSVEAIIEKVKSQGDKALKDLSVQFDNVAIENLFVGKDIIEKLAATIGEKEKQALKTAYANIYAFHAPQLKTEEKIETMPGVTCWRENRAIERVGLYIPGGTAILPSTFLMLGIPAKIAGCIEIIVCSPPHKANAINPYIAYCATLLGVEKIYLVGGAQAVAAMAYGTESIPKVDKIFGPGNQYVTMAKSIIQSNTQVSIDMPAGPSEVLVIADEHANPVFIAADLLAQAEHGRDSQSVLVCTSADLVKQTFREIEKQLQELPRKQIARKAIENSFAVITATLDEAMEFSNKYAPEHLILQTDNWQTLTGRITNAGSVFLGHLTPESAGDYASGTNHTLPTGGFARSYSGVSVDSFVKKITFQHITQIGIGNIGPTVELIAELEGLQAHKNAIRVRAI